MAIGRGESVARDAAVQGLCRGSWIAARSEILTEAWFNAVFGSSQAGTRRTARGELTAVERSFEPGGALGSGRRRSGNLLTIRLQSLSD
jgi:hypothetical protein